MISNEMILASAGSGKTYQLSNRIAGLVLRGVEPRRIAALTFTRKAAGEFADAVVEKLAIGAKDQAVARRLGAEMEVAANQAAFMHGLEQWVGELPRVFLGTLDSFFARVVRGFQYELGVTGGSFELVQGPALVVAQGEVLARILGDGLGAEERAGFVESFKRATFGREEQRVSELISSFVGSWHGRYLEVLDAEAWGGTRVLELVGVDDWDLVKGDLMAELRRAMGQVEWTDKRQDGACDAMFEMLELFTPGDGGEAFKKGLLSKILENWEDVEGGSAVVKFQKEFTLPQVACESLVRTVRSMARAVLEGPLTRTRAIREVMHAYEAHYARSMRERGRMSFADVKSLMGEWACHEEARLRRELVDFRLDGRFDHWLLDEFQDTSRTDWRGVEPLIDEAAMDPEGEKSVFVVGDRKQGIYAWRGGDVGLFDEVVRRYRLEARAMPVSERSGPDVLALVNAVCGDRAVMQSLFPADAVAGWDFEEHVPSERVRDRTGYAGVWEVEPAERLEKLGDLLEEIEPRRRGLSCGVLVRENKEVLEAADVLRARGFEVVEEGKRKPASDNSFGVALLDLFRWLANPEDRFAATHVWMSPLAAVLESSFGDERARCWEACHDFGARQGWARLAEELLKQLGVFSAFGQRRGLELVRGLEEAAVLDDGSAAAMVQFLTGWEVEQAAGAGVIQVMTIHKSKGLGFDVVVVPGLSDGKIPDLSRLKVLEKSAPGGKLEWLSQAPPGWVSQVLPALHEVVDEWSVGQCYEAMCLLYVALTRAKRAQYVFLPPAGKDDGKASLANWVRQCCGGEGDVLAEWGAPTWFRESTVQETEAPAPVPDLPPLAPRRERLTPSRVKSSTGTRPRAGSGMQVGQEVHALFEQIGWLPPGKIPKLPRSQAGAMVEGLLRDAGGHSVFEKPDGEVDLHREQGFEILIDGKWMSGVIDRMHVCRDADGKAARVEIYDFKTDRVESAEELITAYREQVEAYAEAMQAVLGTNDIHCWLVSTALPSVCEMVLTDTAGDEC